MALDEALLEMVAAGRSGPVLRLYRWQPATVTLGYGQRGSKIVNLDACERLGLDVVRRCTGGRAVLHDDEVTYAVIAPVGEGAFPAGVLDSYRVIADVLQRVYHCLGIDAILATGRQPGSGGSGAEQSACFTAPGHYELLYRGCKLAGCAQKRVPGAFLQHGSLPVNLDLKKLYTALDTEQRLSPAAGARLLQGHVGWINRWRQQPVAVEDVEELLINQFRSKLFCHMESGIPTDLEMALMKRLRDERYGEQAWNRKGLTLST